MPTREQVRALLDGGLDYAAAGQRLGIPAGQVYLIATGRPADGGDALPPPESAQGGLLASSQHLANPPHENPTTSSSVREWIAGRVTADKQMTAAAGRRDAEPAEPGSPGASHDAIMVLTREHNQVRALQEQLAAIPSHRTGGSPSDLEQRKSIVDMITVRLSQHETAEEEHLWPAVRAALPDGDSWADAALHQEQEGKDTLTQLGRLAPDTEEFDDLVEQLIRQLRKHVAYEEQVFLRLRDHMAAGERERLGDKLLAASKRGPTRPHRRGTKKPGMAVKAAAGGAAAADKLRDAAGDRPATRKGKAE